jgi:predicted CoA-binding protein
MISPDAAAEFLGCGRLAVVGASDASGSFGRTVYEALRERDVDVVAVHPTATTVSGDPAVADLASLSDGLDGVIVMVNADAAVDIVRQCADLGIPRVWLFQGLGGAGAVSDEAVELCHQHGIAVIAGACPLMFLEPVGWFHRLHRSARRANGSLARSA